MKAIAEWLRSVGQTVQRTSQPATAGRSDDAGTSLFHCSDCDTVYVATEKQTCSTCRTDVERVPSTFDDT